MSDQDPTISTDQTADAPAAPAPGRAKKAVDQKSKEPTRLFIAYRPELEAPPRAAGFGITTGVRQRQNYRFEPGINVMSADSWNQIKDYSPISDRVARGVLVAHGEDPDVTAEQPSEIFGLKESVALAVVEESRDILQLKRWMEREQGKRARVAQAIARQISALNRGVVS
jgi:hypothetical protein